MLTQWEAVEKRISCRAYQERFVGGEILEQLQNCIETLNQQSGLHFQLAVSEEKGKPAVKLADAMFSGKVYLCALLVGGSDDISAEKVGYYGEKLVLFATQLGLGTCWVAGTFDRNSVSPVLQEGEKLWDVVPMGYAVEKTPLKQQMIRAGIRKRDRKLEKFLESDVKFSEVPAWVQKGIKAVQLGPSAVNQQPVNIVYKDGKVSAKLWKDGHGLGMNDLGIAKMQFEAGAAACGVTGNWSFGDGAEFSVSV